MVLRALFALAFVCLVPIHEPNIGLPMPPHGVNQALVEIRQSLAGRLLRAGEELRLAGSPAREKIATSAEAASVD